MEKLYTALEKKEFLEKILPFSKYSNLKLAVSIIGFSRFLELYEFFADKPRKERNLLIPSRGDICRLWQNYSLNKAIKEDKKAGVKTNWNKLARRLDFKTGQGAKVQYEVFKQNDKELLLFMGEYLSQKGEAENEKT